MPAPLGMITIRLLAACSRVTLKAPAIGVIGPITDSKGSFRVSQRGIDLATASPEAPVEGQRFAWAAHPTLASVAVLSMSQGLAAARARALVYAASPILSDLKSVSGIT